MKLKILSDGTSSGTRVVNAETGEPVEDITYISWWLSASPMMASAKIIIEKVPVELAGTVEQPSAEGDQS